MQENRQLAPPDHRHRVDSRCRRWGSVMSWCTGSFYRGRVERQPEAELPRTPRKAGRRPPAIWRQRCGRAGERGWISADATVKRDGRDVRGTPGSKILRGTSGTGCGCSGKARLHCGSRSVRSRSASAPTARSSHGSGVLLRRCRCASRSVSCCWTMVRWPIRSGNKCVTDTCSSPMARRRGATRGSFIGGWHNRVCRGTLDERQLLRDARGSGGAGADAHGADDRRSGGRVSASH